MILKRKKMFLLTREELKSRQDEKLCYICGKKNLKKSYLKVKSSKK